MIMASSDNETGLVLQEDHGAGVVTLTLNRPASLNALNVPMLEALVAGLRDVHGAAAVVIRGAGRAFCVGEDLKETLAPKTGDAQELRESFEMLQDVTRLMTANPAPIIAAVSGYAVGGGAEIALAADLVVFDTDARLRFPEVPIGHAHTGGISVRLPAMVGLLKAKELLLTGRWVDSAEAVSIGLANEVTQDPYERALAWATSLAQQPRRSMAATKRAVELTTFGQQETALRLEVEAALYCFASADAESTFEQFSATGAVPGSR
jgi:2-(1,2-epoxy-1,2-dihydrophenyl)acetyl-CoA isomerase